MGVLERFGSRLCDKLASVQMGARVVRLELQRVDRSAVVLAGRFLRVLGRIERDGHVSHLIAERI